MVIVLRAYHYCVGELRKMNFNGCWSEVESNQFAAVALGVQWSVYQCARTNSFRRSLCRARVKNNIIVVISNFYRFRFRFRFNIISYNDTVASLFKLQSAINIESNRTNRFRRPSVQKHHTEILSQVFTNSFIRLFTIVTLAI